MSTKKPKPLTERILAALGTRSSAPYWDLMRAVFPYAEYPRAWNYQANGGPPGCAMAFNAALRRLGGGWRQAPDRTNRIAYIDRDKVDQKRKA